MPGVDIDNRFDGNQNRSKKGGQAQVPRKLKKNPFLEEMVLLRSKRMIPMILLYLMTMLTAHKVNLHICSFFFCMRQVLLRLLLIIKAEKFKI